MAGSTSTLGIAAIAVHQPDWELANGWFRDTIPRKFGHHTGIEARGISRDDEMTMGMHAVRALQHDTGCDLADCRGILFVSPSMIPPSVAHRLLSPQAAAAERPGRVARLLVQAMGLARCRAVGLNWFCCGYSRALAFARHQWTDRLALRDEEYVIVVVATRISRITDYGCGQTAGLFGDMASATLLAPPSSRRHPVHFEIVHAHAERQPVERPFFDFHVRHGVPVPEPDGGMRHEAGRLVYSIDGMGIAETAPRAMAAAVARGLSASGLVPEEVCHVVPHQAGTGIVRFTGMQLEDHGVHGDIVNGLTRRTGNVSACSVPHALHHEWDRLGGIVACPTAAVGAPGRAEVLQGCVLLRATATHERRAGLAA